MNPRGLPQDLRGIVGSSDSPAMPCQHDVLSMYERLAEPVAGDQRNGEGLRGKCIGSYRVHGVGRWWLGDVLRIFKDIKGALCLTMSIHRGILTNNQVYE